MGVIDLDFNFNDLNLYKIDYDNLHTILLEMKELLISSLEEAKMSITKENINVNSKNITSQKVTYLLDEESKKEQ